MSWKSFEIKEKGWCQTSAQLKKVVKLQHCRWEVLQREGFQPQVFGDHETSSHIPQWGASWTEGPRQCALKPTEVSARRPCFSQLLTASGRVQWGCQARPLLGDTKLLWLLALAWGLPSGFAKTFSEMLYVLKLFLLHLPCCVSYSVGIRPASRSDSVLIFPYRNPLL